MSPSPAGDAGDAFDPDYYRKANDDVRAFGFDPTDHYIRFGRAEGRPANARQAARLNGRPAENLDDDQVTRIVSDLRDAMIDHSRAGAADGGATSRPAVALPDDVSRATAGAGAAEDDELDDRPPGWFDPVFYREQNPDVASKRHDVFQHYASHGCKEGRSPNRVIARVAPRKSIKVHGHMGEERATILASGLFDVRWYAETYRIRPERAIAHYVWMGAFMGHDPSLFFSSLDYIKANPDILTVGLNPLAHYVSYGFLEGRGGVKMLAETRLTANVWLKGF
jgi:hypothetical protein